MAKSPYEFPADIAFRDAARVALLAGFQKMMDHFSATRDGLDSETPTQKGVAALHDMRVGSRRLRAALSVFAKVFPTDDFRNLERQVAAITDALGAVRDLDVQLESFHQLTETLPENEAYGIRRLITRQTRRRNKRRKDLICALETLERDRFDKRFLKALEKAAPETVAAGADKLGADKSAADHSTGEKEADRG